MCDSASEVGLPEVVAGAIVGPVGQAALTLVALGPRGPGADVVDGARGVRVEHAQTNARLLIGQRIAILKGKCIEFKVLPLSGNRLFQWRAFKGLVKA